MSKSEVFAALQITDYEVRLVVAELHNFKLNVLKVERVETSGVDKADIANEEAIIAGIRKAVTNASRLIGAAIKRVILIIPSINVGRLSKRIIVSCDRNVVTKNEVRQAVDLADTLGIREENVVINAVPLKYTLNGYTTRRMPLNESGDSLAVELEVLSANKDIVFKYVSAVEKAGLKVIDICLDNFAIATEAALFEQTIDQYLLVLNLERQTSTLSLLSGGKMVETACIESGYGNIIGEISEKYNLPLNICARLLMYNIRLKQENLPESPVYYWTVDAVPRTVSEKELAELVQPSVDKWLNGLKEVCQPILDMENVKVVLTGSGAMLQNLQEYCSELFERETSIYMPETIGVRSSALTCCMGAIYSYIDKTAYLDSLEYSIDEEDYRKINVKKEIATVSEETFTGRFKKIFTKN